MLQRSIDGGMTWGMQQPWRSMGKIGEYQRRLRWMGQGAGLPDVLAAHRLRPRAAHHHRRARRHRRTLMAGPNTPVYATFPIPPPVIQLPWGKVENGMVTLTPSAYEFLQWMWAAIQGQGD
jgi:hypothetical protein